MFYERSDSAVSIEGERGYIRHACDNLRTYRSVELMLLVGLDYLLSSCCYPYPSVIPFCYCYYCLLCFLYYWGRGLVCFLALEKKNNKNFGERTPWLLGYGDIFTIYWSFVKFKEGVRRWMFLPVLWDRYFYFSTSAQFYELTVPVLFDKLK